MAFEPRVKHYRFYNDDGGEADSTPLAAEDTAMSYVSGSGDTIIHLRWMLQEEGGTTQQENWRTFRSLNGGADTQVTSTTNGVINHAPTSQLTDGNATTNRATNGLTDGTGSFVAGEQDDNLGVSFNTNLTANNYTEHVGGMTIVDADVSPGDTITFSLNDTSFGDVPLDVTPTINVISATSVALTRLGFHAGPLANWPVFVAKTAAETPPIVPASIVLHQSRLIRPRLIRTLGDCV